MELEICSLTDLVLDRIFDLQMPRAAEVIPAELEAMYPDGYSSYMDLLEGASHEEALALSEELWSIMEDMPVFASRALKMALVKLFKCGG